MNSFRFLLAVIAGKSAYLASRLNGGAGAALPGLVAERVYPGVLEVLSQQCTGGSIVICGTNGKTTTSRILSEALNPSHPNLVYNRSGSNLIRGHIAAFLEQSSWSGKLHADLAILETDEAVLPHLLKRLSTVRAIVLHNLFRDQLDRYGEVDTIARKWLEALKANLKPETILLINADDPSLAFIARELRHPHTVFYGLDDSDQGSKQPTSTLDAILSPISGKELEYSTYYLSHLGDYKDSSSDFRRPELAVAAQKIAVSESGFSFELHTSQQSLTLSSSLPGLYNLYNALAASACFLELSQDTAALTKAVKNNSGAFGRFEKIQIDNKELVLCLIKNPVGATEVMRTLSTSQVPYGIALLANDNFADGQDVSWYWDAQFELLKDGKAFFCGGTRAEDMAVRLKYAGITLPIVVEPDIAPLFDRIISQTPTQKVYVLTTYTAAMALQKLLSDRGYKQPYWQE